MKNGFRVFLWLAGGTVGLIVLIVLVMLLMVRWSERAVTRYQEELEQRGESFDLKSLEPPPAKTENNGGPSLLTTARELSGLKYNRWKLEPEIKDGAWVAVHRRDTIPVYSPTALSWAEAELRQAALRAQLAALITASNSPTLELDIHFEVMPFPPAPELSQLEMATTYLAEDACLRLWQHDVPGASANIEAMLKIARMMSRHPGPPAQQTVENIIRKAQLATWEALHAEGLNPADLARLQAVWVDFEPVTSLGKQLRYHRAASLVLVTWANAEFRKQLSTLATWRDNRGMIQILPWLMIYQPADMLNFLKNSQQVLDAIPDTSPVPYAHLVEMTSPYKNLPNAEPNPRLATNYFSQEIAESILKRAEAETWQALTITAIALQRYQLDHEGIAPPSLEVLVPKYLTSLPQDPFGAGPFRYRANGNEFLLYSVGDNLSDDGGEAGPNLGHWKAAERKDIVWPRAAAR